MSLITDALRKAENPSISTEPVWQKPQPRRPRWLAGALLIVLAMVVVGVFGRSRPHPTVTSSTSSSETISSPAPTKNLGLNLLRSAETQWSSWRLTGIIHSNVGKPLALLNNAVVEEGESVQGAKVVRVTQDEVELETSSGMKTLKLH